jgi:colanic acid biosynthesis protein WcaH
MRIEWEAMASGLPPAAEAPSLQPEEFAAVVAAAPLVSIDLIVTNGEGAALLGLRANQPALGWWFVPGGRIRKNESLDAALRRLTGEELGLSAPLPEPRFGGVYEHFYDIDFRGIAGASTHYLALAYRLRAEPAELRLPHQQHTSYRWFQPQHILDHPDIHPYARAYFVK